MKTTNIIIIAIIGIVITFFTGVYLGTRLERVHHENWYGKYDRAYTKYLENTNKKISEKWKSCQEEVFELEKEVFELHDKNNIPTLIQDSLQQVMAQVILERMALKEKYEKEKEAKLEEVKQMKTLTTR